MESSSIDLTNPETVETLITTSKTLISSSQTLETLHTVHLPYLLSLLSPESPLLLLHLRLLRNLCSIPTFQSSFIQSNGPDRLFPILTNSTAQILKVGLQVLGNAVMGGEAHVRAVWDRFFPDGFVGFAKSGVLDPLCMILDTCCSGIGGRKMLHELCEDGKGLEIVLELVKTACSKGYKEEWLEWLLTKICIEESYLNMLFAKLVPLSISKSSDCPEFQENMFTLEQVFLLRTLSNCLSERPDEVTVTTEFALGILQILKEACRSVDFSLKGSSELPTGSPSIDVLGYSVIILRDTCAWEGHNVNELPVKSLLSAGIVELFLNLLRELEPPLIIKKCIEKAKVQDMQEAMAGKVCPYKGYRRDLVSVITNCLYRRKKVQEEIKERDGILLLLQQCVLDEDNPYLREWGMLAMSNLINGNVEIQHEIMEFQLQAPVQTPEIAVLGLEVVIDEKTGRAKLMNKPSLPHDNEKPQHS